MLALTHILITNYVKPLPEEPYQWNGERTLELIPLKLIPLKFTPLDYTP